MNTMTVNTHDSPKVLVVDDHPENLVAMRHILAKLDGEVVCAASGNEALSQLLRNDFAVALMDVQMPEMDGFETARLIRYNEETKALPIIFVTAISKEKQYVEQGYELGAVDYLFKPFDPQILRYKVEVFLELFRQRNDFLALARKNQLILDSVKEGVLGLNTDGEIIFSNPAAARLLNLDSESLQGRPVTSFIAGCQDSTWESTDIYRTCHAGNTFTRSDRYFQPVNGERYPVECSASAMYDRSDEPEGFVLVFTDISERRKAEQQLAQLAEYDPLTGLANRRLFYRMLPKMIAKARRLNHQVALIYIDLDHFKSVNDTLGHVIGDLLLTQVAGRLTHLLRESDTVVRLSGDEFAVVLEGNLNHQGITKVAVALINCMAKPFDLNHKQVRCTISMGIAIAPEIGWDANELIKAADTAMYNAKTNGRNNFQFYDESLSKEVSYRAQVENQLLQAVDQQELSLVYQPKFNIASGKLHGFESLLRWNSTGLGNVSPVVFIPIAESNGQIIEIGEWVLSQASRQLHDWARQGVIDKDFSLSVNFSIKQLNHPELLVRLEKILNNSHIDPANLDVEITETTLMSNPDSIIPLLRTLSEMGMTISVDDFGTGYSSLNYLRLLPINYLKIDRSFIKDLAQDSNSEIITRSIINLAHNLDLQVVAEGIETPEQKEFLEHYGCDFGQGYLLGKPKPAEEAEDCFKTLRGD
ncbi:EAL domain-containing protein [Marinobacterium arenosum]|uniref:EAL domain-containing protein n=1 Tax=Marinobacterium arenosum TaxID=2862496 RepID=UPI001C946C11|nr:EAL domain-containing protein [Marinobacterium arenosum]MBY4677721.1 EAL domain-containing protein [Marinobacterium arenosum]